MQLTAGFISMLGQADVPAAAPAPSVGFWIVLLAVLALAPFLFTLITSFAKLVIIGGIMRQAIGTPQIPPNSVITGIALILTLHIMSPVAIDAFARYKTVQQQREVEIAALPEDQRAAKRAEYEATSQIVDDVLVSVEQPIRKFLTQHASKENVALFERLQAKLSRGNDVPAVNEAAKQFFGEDENMQRLVHDLVVLAPAFMLTELIEAFQIGFMIFIPFLVIDLAVSNILLAMGMHMLSPVTISLPFKLLLFVLIDGWTLILQGVVLGYT